MTERAKQAAKDFALQKFAKDLISEIDILHLALRSIPADKLAAADANKDLLSLHEGVTLTKRGMEKVLERHGVVAFDPVGEQFDPNKHEALYQAPVPGKEPGSVLECQEIGCASLFLFFLPPVLALTLSVFVLSFFEFRRHPQRPPPPPRQGRRRPLPGVKLPLPLSPSPPPPHSSSLPTPTSLSPRPPLRPLPQ